MIRLRNLHILLILLICFICIACEVSAHVEAGQIPPQLCGQGIILKGNGAVMIDKWTGYTGVTNNPAQPNQSVSTFDAPTEIHFAKEIKDSTKICFENSDSITRCTTLGSIRSVK